MKLEVRNAVYGDLPMLLKLYAQFHGEEFSMSEATAHTWKELLADPKVHVIAGVLSGTVVSSCVIVIVPNLTHGQRPYAWIENVVTDEKHRGNGYALAVLDFAKEIARKQYCYKIMLMTGAKEDSTLHFYEKAGYNRQDKKAFIQWL